MDTLLEVAATRSLPDRALVQETRSDYGWETRSDYECPYHAAAPAV